MHLDQIPARCSPISRPVVQLFATSPISSQIDAFKESAEKTLGGEVRIVMDTFGAGYLMIAQRE